MQDLIVNLLNKDPNKRLGGGPEDALEIKRHQFFKGLNWTDLGNKKIQAPFVPKIIDELDVSNFADEFTSMVPADSPAITPPSNDRIFKGYSYVAPSVLFSDNVISDDLFYVKSDPRPHAAQLLAARFKVSRYEDFYHLPRKEACPLIPPFN